MKIQTYITSQYLVYKIDGIMHSYLIRKKYYLKILNLSTITTDIEFIYLNYLKRIYKS